MSLLRSACRVLTVVYLVLAVASLLLIPAADAGFLGLGPFAASFPIFLGLPWSLAVGKYVSATNLLWNMLLFALPAALNALILLLLCRVTRGFHEEG